MGIFDRFRNDDKPRGRTYEAHQAAPSADEQALARYRYMLRTAPPEAVEQAHAEAFEKLTPAQRRMLLEQLRAEAPEAERAYATDDPRGLARMATRAEVRQPGTLERTFGRMPSGGPGFGGILAGSLLGSVAGTVLGTMIAQNFLGGHGAASDAGGAGQSADAGQDAGNAGGADADAYAAGDDGGGGFDDGGTFDV